MTSNSDPNQKTPIETSTPSTTDESYTPYIADEVKSKPNWLWLLPLLLVTLVIGLFAGRMWGEKQPGDDALNTERSVSPQVGTATGVTEIEKEVNQKPVLTVLLRTLIITARFLIRILKSSKNPLYLKFRR